MDNNYVFCDCSTVSGYHEVALLATNATEHCHFGSVENESPCPMALAHSMAIRRWQIQCLCMIDQRHVVQLAQHFK